MEKISIGDFVNASVIRSKQTSPVENLGIKGVYDVEVIRDGKIIHSFTQSNTVTTEGMRYLLDAGLGNSGTYTLSTAWYVALVYTTGAIPIGNWTYGHVTNKWSAEHTDYSGAVRDTWDGVLHASAASISNSASKATFTITATPDSPIVGAALVNVDTKGDWTESTGVNIIFSYSEFLSSVAVEENDVVNVTITIALS